MKARPDRDAWALARSLWESDSSQTFEAIAKRVDVTRAAVSKRAKQEGWTRPSNLKEISEAAQVQADSQVAPQLLEVDGARAKRDAIHVRSVVLARHRTDWVEHRRHFPLSRIAEDFEAGKQAKISAEMLLLRQRGEREAYGIEVHAAGGASDGLPLVTVKDLTGRKYT